LWNRTYVLALFSTFAFWLNVDALLLVLPLYMNDAGYDPAAIGIVFGAAAPAAILARLLSGRTIDRRGGWWFLLVGAMTWAVTSSAMAVTASLLLLLLLRATQGLGLGVYTNASLGYVVYNSAVEHRDRAVGWWGAASPIMAAVGPIVAAFTLQAFGFAAAFAVAAGAGVLAAAAGLLLPRSWKDLDEQPGAVARGAKPYVPGAVVPGLFGAAAGFAYGAFAAFAPILAAELRLANAGVYMSLAAVGTIAARFAGGPLSDSKGRQWVILPGFALAALAMGVIGFVEQPYLALGVPLFFGLGMGSAVPGLVAWAVSRAEEAEKATAGGTFYNFFEVGLFLGAPVLGGAIQGYGFAGFALVAAILAVACAGYSWAFRAEARELARG
jgi:MFS family permease